MRTKVGIGIPSYNRASSLEKCISAVRRLTPQPFELVIADDGSTDGTAEMCARENVVCIRGRNRGVAWNKNRALFFLHRVLDCDILILLEDDCYPKDSGWHDPWIRAAEMWGHINLAGLWFRERFLGGAGSVTEPFISKSISAQCAAFSRRALSAVGFFDSRFKTYGYEHLEHSTRLVRAGFGGEIRRRTNGKSELLFYLLAANLTMAPTISYRSETSVRTNREIWERIRRDYGFRLPWRSAEEYEQFRKEIESGIEIANLSWTRRILTRRQWVMGRPLKTTR